MQGSTQRKPVFLDNASMISEDKFDPAVHQLPIAYEHLPQGSLVVLCVGKTTFTAELAKAHVPWLDGAVLESAPAGDPVKIIAQHGSGRKQSSRSGHYKPNMIWVIRKTRS